MFISPSCLVIVVVEMEGAIMLKQILVPLDGSALGETAVPHAIALAKQTNAMVHLVRVVTAPINPVADPVDAEVEVLESAEVYLTRWAVWLQCQGITVQRIVRYGETVEQLLDKANQVNADIIVMATRGRSGVQRAVLGSVAEQIVRKAPCPVLLVHGQPVSATYSRILVPLDGTPLGEAMLPLAAKLARIHHAELILLHVVKPRDLVDIWSVKTDEEKRYIQEATTRAHKYLGAIAGSLSKTGIKIDIICRAGVPEKVIETIARQEQPDLIAMATHTRGLVGRALFGSVADAILHRVDLPLALYHYRGEVLERSPEAEPAFGKLDIAPTV